MRPRGGGGPHRGQPFSERRVKTVAVGAHRACSRCVSALPLRPTISGSTGPSEKTNRIGGSASRRLIGSRTLPTAVKLSRPCTSSRRRAAAAWRRRTARACRSSAATAAAACRAAWPPGAGLSTCSGDCSRGSSSTSYITMLPTSSIRDRAEALDDHPDQEVAARERCSTLSASRCTTSAPTAAGRATSVSRTRASRGAAPTGTRSPSRWYRWPSGVKAIEGQAEATVGEGKVEHRRSRLARAILETAPHCLQLHLGRLGRECLRSVQWPRPSTPYGLLHARASHPERTLPSQPTHRDEEEQHEEVEIIVKATAPRALLGATRLSHAPGHGAHSGSVS